MGYKIPADDFINIMTKLRRIYQIIENNFIYWEWIKPFDYSNESDMKIIRKLQERHWDITLTHELHGTSIKLIRFNNIRGLSTVSGLLSGYNHPFTRDLQNITQCEMSLLDPDNAQEICNKQKITRNCSNKYTKYGKECRVIDSIMYNNDKFIKYLAGKKSLDILKNFTKEEFNDIIGSLFGEKIKYISPTFYDDYISPLRRSTPTQKWKTLEKVYSDYESSDSEVVEKVAEKAEKVEKVIEKVIERPQKPQTSLKKHSQHQKDREELEFLAELQKETNILQKQKEIEDRKKDHQKLIKIINEQKMLLTDMAKKLKENILNFESQINDPNFILKIINEAATIYKDDDDFDFDDQEGTIYTALESQNWVLKIMQDTYKFLTLLIDGKIENVKQLKHIIKEHQRWVDFVSHQYENESNPFLQMLNKNQELLERQLKFYKIN